MNLCSCISSAATISSWVIPITSTAIGENGNSTIDTGVSSENYASDTMKWQSFAMTSIIKQQRRK